MRIAVITHPFDERLETGPDGVSAKSTPYYQLDAILLAARRVGADWFHTDPWQPFEPADAAIVQVDLTVIAQEFLDLAQRYRTAANVGAADISKRRVSLS